MTSKDYFIGLKNNDHSVIEKFYEKYEQKFKQSIRKKYSALTDDELADIYQDTVIRLWENIQRGRLTLENLTSDIGGYLYGIGMNVLSEYIRTKNTISIEELAKLEFVEEEKSEEELRFIEIREKVNNLGGRCAAILLAFYWNEWKMEEIAKELNYSNADSAKAQKNKCMNKLKESFKKNDK